MKKFLALTLSLLLFIAVLPSYAANSTVNMPTGEPIIFSVANDVLQELKYATIPIVRNNKYYIPYSLLTNNFNIRSSYSSKENVLYLSNMHDNIKFDIDAGCAYDKNGKINEAAIIAKGQVFVPLDFICRYLDLSYAYLSDGPIIRIRDDNIKYPDTFLSVLFESRIKDMREEFLKNFKLPTSEPPTPETKNATVYLTFDDGPSEYTSSIIDALNVYNYNATFFLIGNRMAQYEDSVRKLYVNGNTVALHSYSHSKDDFFSSSASMLNELNSTNKMLRRILQTESRLVRVPYGSGTEEFAPELRNALLENGYRYWDWTIHANDLDDNATSNRIYNNITSQLSKSKRDTEVILMHETKQTSQMLPRLLKYLWENKYEVKIITPLDSPVNVRGEE